jgi:large subunit ribosomal protein L4
MEESLLDINGKQVGKTMLPVEIFAGCVNRDLLYQAVYSYLANKKSHRLASTKTRSEVRGSGAKPWRQKGTGRARVGTKRNPVWVKGGITFGPKPKKVYKRMPKKMKLGALKSALVSKYQDKELLFIESLDVGSPKTKSFIPLLKNLGLDKRSVFVDTEFSRKVFLSCRNLKNISLVRAKDLNAYSALNCRKLILTQKGLETITERIKKI